MRAPSTTIAFAAALVVAQAQSPKGLDATQVRQTDPAVAAHCLSNNPARLALTDEQVAHIDAIRRDHPDDSAERRAAILRVLTRTQWMVFWRTAGVAAC